MNASLFDRWRNVALWHFLALGCYTLLGLLVTFPLITQFDRQIIANQPGQVDGYLGIWNVWWTSQALTSGEPLYHTPRLFHPQGLDLFWQTLSVPQGLLALPITLLFEPLVAYNFLIVASYTLGGYAAFLFVRYLLAREYGLDWATQTSALIAGAIYALAPFHNQKVLDAQLEVASIQWLPLALLAVHILLERRTWPWVIISALLLLWVGLGTWYYGLFVLIYTGMAAGLWALGGTDWPDRLRRLAWGLSPLVVWLVLMAQRLIDLARTGDELLGDARVEQYDAAADLIAFWLPNPLHPLWGAAIERMYLGWYPGDILWNVSLGLVGTILAIGGVWVARLKVWRWVVLAVLTALFAMGAELKLFGFETGLPLPYALLRDLPGIRSSHRPNHIVLITILITALLAAYGVRSLLSRWPRWRWGIGAGLLVAIFAIDGWAGSQPLFARPMPTAYHELRAAEGAFLPIPTHLNISNSEHLWYQTVHERPIIGGFIGREPPYPLARYAPGFKELRFGVAEADDIISPGWPSAARESLAAYGISHVLYHPPTMRETLPSMQALIGEMGLVATVQDPLLEVYPVPPLTEVRPLVYLGAGWGPIERDGDDRWRWMEGRAEIYLYNPHSEVQVIRLHLDLEAYERERPLTIVLGEQGQATLNISRARMQRTIGLLLPPGEHVVYLEAPSEAAPGSGRPISIAFLGITVE